MSTPYCEDLTAACKLPSKKYVLSQDAYHLASTTKHNITQPERSPADELNCLVAKAREGPLLHIPIQ